MKVQIVSLQRTGSKVLNSALASKVDSPSYDLGEFLHGWEEHGYKFEGTAKRPFDSAAQIWFHTHPGFRILSETVNFTPTFAATGYLSWAYAPYVSERDYDSLAADRLEMVRTRNLPVLVKTQLAYLVERVELALYLKNLKNLADTEDYIPRKAGIFPVTADTYLDAFELNIAVVPRDPIRWAMSNIVCDVTGIFVPGAAMNQAVETMLAAPIWVGENCVAQLGRRLKCHLEIANSHKCGMRVTTEDLTKISSALGLGIHSRPEFSAADYTKLIKNYDQVAFGLRTYL